MIQVTHGVDNAGNRLLTREIYWLDGEVVGIASRWPDQETWTYWDVYRDHWHLLGNFRSVAEIHLLANTLNDQRS